MAKVTIVLLSDMETHQDLGRVLNALEATKEFKEAGDEVQLIFDGGGVEAAVAIADPDHKLHRLYTLVEDKIAGICRYCARAFEFTTRQKSLASPFWPNMTNIPVSENG